MVAGMCATKLSCIINDKNNLRLIRPPVSAAMSRATVAKLLIRFFCTKSKVSARYLKLFAVYYAVGDFLAGVIIKTLYSRTSNTHYLRTFFLGKVFAVDKADRLVFFNTHTNKV